MSFGHLEIEVSKSYTWDRVFPWSNRYILTLCQKGTGKQEATLIGDSVQEVWEKAYKYTASSEIHPSELDSLNSLKDQFADANIKLNDELQHTKILLEQLDEQKKTLLAENEALKARLRMESGTKAITRKQNSSSLSSPSEAD